MAKKKPKPPVEDLFSAAASRAARDEGMNRVHSHNIKWTERVMDYIRTLPPEWTGPSEDIRRQWQQFNDPPSHHNAWGSVAKIAEKRGLIQKTGKQVSMKFEKSHSRSTPEYRRVS